MFPIGAELVGWFIGGNRLSWSSYNQVVCGLQFLDTHTHRVPWPVTMVYLHVRRLHLASTPSPLDWLLVRQLPHWQQTGQSGEQTPSRSS